jgi:hypothetical protein
MDSFSLYLIKKANAEAALAQAAQAGSPVSQTQVKAVQEASAMSGVPLTKTKAALLIALGIGVGTTGTLLYNQRKRPKNG